MFSLNSGADIYPQGAKNKFFTLAHDPDRAQSNSTTSDISSHWNFTNNDDFRLKYAFWTPERVNRHSSIIEAAMF